MEDSTEASSAPSESFVSPETSSILRHVRDRIARDEEEKARKQQTLIKLLEDHGMGRIRIRDSVDGSPLEKIIVIDGDLRGLDELFSPICTSPFQGLGFLLTYTASVLVDRDGDIAGGDLRRIRDHAYFVFKVTEYPSHSAIWHTMWRTIEERGSEMFPLCESVADKWIDTAASVKETMLSYSPATIRVTITLKEPMNELEAVMYRYTNICGFHVCPDSDGRTIELYGKMKPS